MADPIPKTKTHLKIQPKKLKKGNTCSDFIIKFLFLAILFIVLPLFPSQAPEFLLNNTLLTKLWELLHLLFIGIVVAYGLFSRRNCELETNNVELETQSSVTTPSYVSKFFPASTIFGDEFEIENSCGFDENKMMHCWNSSQYFEGSNEGNNNSTVGVFDEQYNTQFSVSDENFGYSVRCNDDENQNGTNVVQAWNSEYYYSEPVVVAQPYYGECGGEVVGHKPLGLPVRSLKLVEREVVGCEYVNENESDSSLGSRSSSKRLDLRKEREFGDMDPTNLEEKFNDAAVGGGGIVSPIDWNSRFRRMEREKVYGNVQFRPSSVDETKFEGNGSRTSQSTTSYSSHASMYSSSFDSIASDNINMDFQEEGMRRKEASFVPDSEMMNFRDKDMRRRKKTSFVPAPENMIFEDEDMEQRMNSYMPAFEDTNFQRRDLGKKISLRNRRMGTKGKHAIDVSYSANFRPMSVDETQFESHSSQSFQPTGSSSSSNTRMYSISSDTIDFQEEDMGLKETFPLHTSENVNFQEEDMEQHEKTSYVHASENVNFQEEDLGQKKTSFVHVSDDMIFQEVDLIKKTSQVVSRSETMETRGKYAAVSRPSHFRPNSADETQLESLSTRSLKSMGSFSSQTSVRSSFDSVSSENMNLLQEGLGEKKSLHGSSPSSSSSSPSSSARRNVETSSQQFESHGYHIDNLLEDDLKSSLSDDSKSKSETGGEDDPRGNKESVMHGLHSDLDKPTSLAKALSRGKSVRTRRANGMTSGMAKIDETSKNQADEKVVKKANNVDDTVMRKDKMKSREPNFLLKGISKKTLDCYFPNRDVTFSSHQKRDKPEPSKDASNEDSDIKLESIQGSSDDDDVVSESVNDSGLDSEVDKKASEFIAKFKAQIRLQKIGSIERSKGQKMFGDNNIR